MRNLFMAEWQKIIGHRWMTGFTVWIFPVGAVGVFATFILLLFLMPDSKERLLNAPLVWTEQFIGPWVMFGGTGGGLFVRVLPIVFCASVFAGEYQWGTWKNILPRSQRLELITIKFIVAIVMLILAFFVTSLVAGFATFLLANIGGQTITPEITGDTLQNFFGDYFMAIGLGFVVIILIANYAAVASLITRSVIGGTIGGVGVMIFEEFLLPLLNLLGRLLNIPDIVQIYRFTPTYNLKNATYWIQVGEPSTNQLFIDLAQPDTLLFSIFMLIVWCIGGSVIVSWLFQQQDITT